MSEFQWFTGFILFAIIGRVSGVTTPSPVCTAPTVGDATYAPIQASYSDGEAVTYTCSTGYTLAAGDLTLTCDSAGSWVGTTPTCTIVTCTPDAVANSAKTPDQATYDYNTAVVYSCNTGYDHTGGDLSRTCKSVATWTGATPTCTIRTCTPAAVANSAKAPDQATYDYNTAVVYSCNTGYDHTGGDLSRTCKSDATWTGATPTCTIRTCTPDAVANSAKAPDQATYDYNTAVVYSCNTGYDHTGGDLSRTCKSDATWTGATPTCTIKTCTPDAVANSAKTPDQATYDYNTAVVYSCDTGYDHTGGDLSRTCTAVATWTGATPTCTIRTCTPDAVANSAKTPDQATYDYNTAVVYLCNTGYDHTGGDLSRTCTAVATWTGATPTCTILTCTPDAVANSAKTPDQATYDYNQAVVYSCNTGYDHTGGDLSRTCTAAATWTGATPTCTIKTCAKIAVDFSTASPDQASYDYMTSVTYTCDDAYNQTAGDLTRTCDATGNWDGTLPTCTVAACVAVSTSHATLSPDQSLYQFGSQVDYICELGYEPTAGDIQRTCQTTGLWNGTTPACTLVYCAAPTAVSNSAVSPSSADSTSSAYSTVITYTCDLAYNHTSGNLTRTCTETAAWSGDAPVCTLVACIQENAAHATTSPNDAVHEFDVVIVYACDTGYNKSTGDLTRTCLNTGQWDGTLPACPIVTCSQPNTPAHASLTLLTAEYDYNTDVTYVCDLGYNRTSGDEIRTCAETGEWGGTEANCTLVHCGAPAAVASSSHTPDEMVYDYNATVAFSCDFGYYSSGGELDRRCTELALWSGVTPICTIYTCAREDEPHATVSPVQATYDFNTTVEYSCVIGYNRTGGNVTRTCDHTGTWTDTPIICTIVTCPAPDTIEATLSPSQAEYDYSTTVTYTCTLGYNRTAGDETRTCQHTTQWNGTIANCTLVTCDPPPSVSHSQASSTQTYYNYSDGVTYTCDLGYYHSSGDLSRTCNELAQWTGVTPVCSIVTCSKVAEPHSTVVPDQPTYDWLTSATYSCVIGYNLTSGDDVRYCNYTGTWNNTQPVCTIVECDTPPAVSLATSSPAQALYVYQDVITWTCDFGYELNSGDASRGCTETGEFNGTAPTCTIIKCPTPDTGTKASYTPVLAEYEWKTEIVYECNIGYNHSTGDPAMECNGTKIWSGIAPVCTIVTCDKIDVPFMEFTPYTADTHDFNTTIEYACVVGYNYSYGDVQRTCNYTGLWTGDLPNCTIWEPSTTLQFITCDPPDAVSHSSFSPVQLEHDWNTGVVYTCDDAYHHVAGVTTTTCNETGTFPSVDLDCSALHTFAIDPSEPDVIWMNSTVTDSNIVFNFDGYCDAILTIDPSGLSLSRTIVGTTMTVTVTASGSTIPDIYTVTLSPLRGDRSWSSVNATVFFGDEVEGLQAWVNNDISYLEVGQLYTFETNATGGTTVIVDWTFEDTINYTDTFVVYFTLATRSHTFNTAGNYSVTITARNRISSSTEVINVVVLYRISGLSFTVDHQVTNTTQVVQFSLTFNTTAVLPIGVIDVAVYLQNDANVTFSEELDMLYSLPHVYQYTRLYGTQGFYLAKAKVESALGFEQITINMSVWDNLLPLELVFQDSENKMYTTNETEAVLQYQNVPNAGFQYSVDFGDGTLYESAGDEILYHAYNLSVFRHNYSAAGVYSLAWTADNVLYSRQDSTTIIVQDKIEEFQAWLINALTYLEVGVSYEFQANATQGTNVSIDWMFEDTVNFTDSFIDTFSSAARSHSFNTAGVYAVNITARNLVSSATTVINVHVIYKINGLSFSVDYQLTNTTQTVEFSLTFASTTNLPVDSINSTMDLQNGSNITLSDTLDNSYTLPHIYLYTRLYTTQGFYLTKAYVENILGFEQFSINISVWDDLTPLMLMFLDSENKIYITNETEAILQYGNVPNAGFQYSIDFGNGDTYESTGDSILYTTYNLSVFKTNYTVPGVYSIDWTARNGWYSRQESEIVVVQNKITDFMAWINNDINYIAVGVIYGFETNATHGTNVTVDWIFGDTTNVTDTSFGDFTSATGSHAFGSAGNYSVNISAHNLVTSVTKFINVIVIYRINGLSFNVDYQITHTNQTVVFSLTFDATTNLPVYSINASMDFQNGGNETFTDMLDSSYTLPHVYQYTRLYGTQGFYLTSAKVENIVGFEQFSINVSVWDNLTPLQVVFNDGENQIYTTNETETILQYDDVPNAGFKYSVDFGDGFRVESTGDDILYKLYNLSDFRHTYAMMGVYSIVWTAENALYSRQESMTVVVQDKLLEFKAWINNDINYLEVGVMYGFETNATQGTNINIDWIFGDATNITDTFVGHFTSATRSHAFGIAGSYAVTITAYNLVSSVTKVINVIIIYRLNGLSFNVFNEIANTTQTVTFSLTFDATTNLPVDSINATMDLQNGANETFSDMLNSSYTLPHVYQYTRLYGTQGFYLTSAKVENILGFEQFSINMSVWDNLAPLQLIFNDGASQIYTTNETEAILQYVDIPNAGFKYSVDFGDGFRVESTGDDILYKLYNVSDFRHTYAVMGVYSIVWTAVNALYSRQESMTVVVQDKLLEFKAWINNDINYLEVDVIYGFETNATQGTNISIDWIFGDATNITDPFVGHFTSATRSHAFSIAGNYAVTITAYNLVSSVTKVINVIVIYRINGLSFSVDHQLTNTTQTVAFSLTFDATTNLPVDSINATMDLKIGGNVTFSDMLDNSYSLPHVYQYTRLYGTQGFYLTSAKVENILGFEHFSINMSVWDNLIPLRLIFQDGASQIYTTNETEAILQYDDVPNAGFKYSVDFGDGSRFESTGDDILYHLYNLSDFRHTYAVMGVYTIVWAAENSRHSIQESMVVIVQDKIWEFQAWLNNDIIYLEVGILYGFETNATQGTNVTIDWIFGDATNDTDTFVGHFTSATRSHTFSISGNYAVTITAYNRVTSVTKVINVIIIYRINGLSFSVDHQLTNTTQTVAFSLTFDATTNLAVDSINATMDLQNGANVTFTDMLDSSYTLPHVYQYTRVYGTQGFYLTSAEVENVLGFEQFSINMSVWDNLTPLQLIFNDGASQIYTTNETEAILQYDNVPNAGFKYSIDFGDGSRFESTGDDILYNLYNLSDFRHTYAVMGVYTIVWTAENVRHSRQESMVVIVQDKILEFKAWINNDIHYLEVDVVYGFETNATQGTNVSIDWIFGDATNVTDTFVGHFSSATRSHAFGISRSYAVTITAYNLVTSVTKVINVIVIYRINGLSFSVDHQLTNTTQTVAFSLTFDATTNLAVDSINATMDLQNGGNVTFTDMLDSLYTLPHLYQYTRLYGTQGFYLTSAKVENVLGFEQFSINMSVWDNLTPLQLIFQDGASQMYTTNETEAILQYDDVPNAGFKYSVDFGDGSRFESSGDDILYHLYNLSDFRHTYAVMGVYSIVWTAENARHSRQESMVVIVQDKILEFKAWINNDINYLEVNVIYGFETNATQGTNVSIDWIFGDVTNITDSFVGHFSMATRSHTFAIAGHYPVTITARNLVTSVTKVINVIVIYRLNGLSFIVDYQITNTTQTVAFSLTFDATTILPVDSINATMDLRNGANVTFSDMLDSSYSLPHVYQYTRLYGTQGFYLTSAKVENFLGVEQFSINMSVWDNLIPLRLIFQDGASQIYTTNETEAIVQYDDVPNAGFKYSVDFGDGSRFESSGDAILYHLYNLSDFRHTYAVMGVYSIVWTAENARHSRQESMVVIVQDKILEFKAWINNDINYLEVDVIYGFETNATQGTNVSIDWIFGDATNITDSFVGHFSSATRSHAFAIAGNYPVTITARNLVTSVTKVINVIVIYRLNGLSFNVDYQITNTTQTVAFSLTFDATTILPVDYINATMDLQNGANETFSDMLDSSYTLPHEYQYTRLYGTQGFYLTSAKVENFLGVEQFSINMSVWDNLVPLRMVFQDGASQIYTTNETEAMLQYDDVPNAGFKYSVDFGDGSRFESTGDDILYHLYNLSDFRHTYAVMGVYSIVWTADNARHSRQESMVVIVQDKIWEFKAWLNNEINYIEVDVIYGFETNATQGTNVSIDWIFGDATNVTDTFVGHFTSATRSHGFSIAGNYAVTITAYNLVSSATEIVNVIVIYRISGLSFNVDHQLTNTTETVKFSLTFDATTSLPVDSINATMDLRNSGNVTFSDVLDISYTLPHTYQDTRVYGTQGFYLTRATVENVLGYEQLSINMSVWDNLTPLQLIFQDGANKIYTTNETVVILQYDDVPNAGFTYSIDYGDGFRFESIGDDILYHLYNLSDFRHIYAMMGVYSIVWTADNYRHSRQESMVVVVQDKLWTFKAWLNNDIAYLAVGDTYQFEANATQGTNVSVDWILEDSVTVTDTFTGRFSSASTSHIFNTPGEYNVTVVAYNLVSSNTVIIPVIVIYVINGIFFGVDSQLANTTLAAEFHYHLNATTKLSMDVVNLTLYYNHGTNDSITETFDSSLSLPYTKTFNHLFDVQGLYTATLRAENILGYEEYTIDMRVWDTLDPLNLTFNGDNGKYITNTTMSIIFDNVPNAGFQYTIAYGDGASTEEMGTAILYDLYNLPVFNHTYTAPLVYVIRWTAQNGEYSRSEILPVVVQNKVPDDGYQLEPLMRKYPWINLQTLDISVNITLNATVPIPTNATCIYDPTDGLPQVPNLVYDTALFEYIYTYRSEGVFISTLDCSNEVSQYIYQFNLTVEKFQAGYITLVYNPLLPLNASDTLVVDFDIDNNGFDIIPLQVTFEFDFGDTATVRRRRRRAIVTYDKVTYQHQYNSRGDYTIVLTVTAAVTGTTNTTSYPLRLGILRFEPSGLIAFINTTVITYDVRGVEGAIITYNIDFGDGTPTGVCNANDVSGCSIDHVFPHWGYKWVTAIAINDTFAEYDNVNMTIDNPIVGLYVDKPYTVSIPDGTIGMYLRINETAPVLPYVNCKLSMGDPIKRQTYYETQNITSPDPFFFVFQYISLGIHTLDIYCWNLINDTTLIDYITVTNIDFNFFGTFDRQYSQETTPMRLYTMLDNEIWSRLQINAGYYEKTHVNAWSIDPSVSQNFPPRHSMLFARGTVDDGLYDVILNVYFIEEPGSAIFEPTYLVFISPPPQVEIVGSHRRMESRGLIQLDAASPSYDPVFPEQSGNIVFSWACESYIGSSFHDVLTKHESNSASQECSLTDSGGGLAELQATASPVRDWYVVTVTGTGDRGDAATFAQYIQIDPANSLTIICRINCLSKVARTSQIQLVPVLPDNCAATYTWTLKSKSTGDYDTLLDLSLITETGAANRTLTIKSGQLAVGTWYLVSLQVVKQGVLYGPAYYEFVTNKLPRGGTCRVIPYNQHSFPIAGADLTGTSTPLADVFVAEAGVQRFNLTCNDWEDEGFTEDTWSEDTPLYYYFFLEYGSTVTQHQVLYFDPGKTANLVTFQVGDPDNDYLATVVLRITDVIGDYTELRYSVVSRPSLVTADISSLDPAAVTTQVRNFVQQFDDDILKANRSYDYRTFCRKIQDITSVYNALVLNSTDILTLTPDDLLSLGYKTTNEGDLVSWADYWRMIVEVVDTSTADFLIQTGDGYTSIVYTSIITWPEDKRMTLVAIETHSRALNASMAVIDYSNATGAVLSAESVNIMARNLAVHVQDRTFPHTENLWCAALVLIDVMRNVLAYLQTVLTPNLPADPTVDEMRSYLVYIKTFKTVEEVATEPLSLQEQTFLAQKQLQKYFVQKHIKSEASKLALPHITYALRNLTYVMSEMSRIGQRELYMENDHIYVSSETATAAEYAGSTLYRPRVALELTSLVENTQMPCNSSEITIRTILFKMNPYFWGTFADRITSYVPVFDIVGGYLKDPVVTYRLKNQITPACSDATPTYEEDNPDKMIFIMFDRQFSDDDILLFIRPNATELVYKAYFNKENKPSIEDNEYIYSTDIKTDKWTQEDGYKVLIPSTAFSATGKIWIALRPLLENSVDLSLTTRPFCANVTSVNCLLWTQDSNGDDYWDRELCQVSRTSTREETVCDCTNLGDSSLMTVGTTFYVPPSKIDFIPSTEDTTPLGNATVIGTMIATAIAYFLLVCWAWRHDMKDQYKWSFALLVDNDIADSYFYIIRVYTGMRTNAGTQSNVGFVLVGEDNDTGIRMLDDESHIGFETGSVRTFVLSTRRLLGDVLCLRIWHDDSGGNDSSWYLNKITTIDLQTGRRYEFNCNQWFDYMQGDTKVDRVLNARTDNERRSFQEMVSYTTAENHIWASVVIRPLKSNFDRVQRISCVMGLVYMLMTICTLGLRTTENTPDMQSVVIGPFRFSEENFKIALLAVAIATPLIMLVAFLFKNAKSPSWSARKPSCFRKAYREVNSLLKIDKSVLSTDYIPPADEAVMYEHHFLPHFCVYIAWAVLAVSVAIATYLLLTFSTDWKETKSDEWMSTMLLSMIVSVLIIEPLKVAMIVTVVELMCNRAYDPPFPEIDLSRLMEITKRNSAFMPQGHMFTSGSKAPLIPDEETLDRNKRKRIGQHELLKIFYQLVVFSGVLFIVYTISFESRDPRSYYFKNHMDQMFQFNSLNTTEAYIEWLKGDFLNTYFSSSHFGAAYTDDGANKIFAEDLANVRVGPARLRQLRITEETCKGPLAYVFKRCVNKYVDKKTETRDFCIGWKDMPCAVSEKADYFSSSAWLFNSSAEVWGFITIATYTTYMGGGYFMKMDVNRDVCLRIFDELFTHSWIDQKTRAVILEFSVYNANSNLFTYNKFVAEFPEVGGILTYIEIQTFRLFSNADNGNFILFLQFTFFILVIVGSMLMLYGICSDGRTFFRSVWNWLDMLGLVLSFITIGVYIYKLHIVQKTIGIFRNDKNAYVGFENLAFYDLVVNTTYSTLVFLLSIRVSKILGYSGKIHEMAAVITNAASDLLGFVIIFSITYFAYVALGTLLFGKDTDKYRDMFQTYGTITEALIGKNRLHNILTSSPGLAEFYYFTFVLFVLMTLATMAAAILNFSISQVRADEAKNANPNIVEVIFDKLAKLIRSTGGSKTDNDKGVFTKRRSEGDLMDIISDFRFFIKDVKTQTRDKYRQASSDYTPSPTPRPPPGLKMPTI